MLSIEVLMFKINYYLRMIAQNEIKVIEQFENTQGLIKSCKSMKTEIKSPQYLSLI